jgi:phosphohistidine phosphatase
MKTVLILRHAKSSWSNARLADHDRPLNSRGKRDAPHAGRWLRDQDLTPDLIVTSSAERALATAEAVALASDYDREIAVTRAFYHAGPENYLELLGGLSDEYKRVLVVGHNPGLEELVEQLSGRAETMVTAALAVIDLSIEHWHELDEATQGTLVAHWRPSDSA